MNQKHLAVELEIALSEPAVQTQERIAAEKDLLRRIDLRLMPMIMLIYTLNYLDRTNIGSARLGTLEEDTGIHKEQYNTMISIFYVGYILTQIPTNMILSKVRPSIFLPVVMCCWATVSASCGAARSYKDWIVLRFLLGVVEAPFFPGAMFLLSSWYTKRELAKRVSILYAAAQMAGAFGGLLASAIMAHMDDKAGIAAWRWLFIIEGSMTIPVAIAAIFVLPDYPSTTKWLSESERALAILRITEEAHEEDKADISVFTGLRMALTDPALYVLWLVQLGLNTAASFTNFFPSIVATLGYSRTITLLLTAPPYAFAAILSIANSFHSDKVKERYLHVVWPQIFACVGFIISAVTMNKGARYTATFMMLSIYGSFGCIMSWISSTLPRPNSKRAVSYAFVNGCSNIAAIYGSYFYPATQGPQYWQANIANVAFSILCIGAATGLRIMLLRRNNKLERLGRESPANGDSEVTGYAKSLQCNPEYRFNL